MTQELVVLTLAGLVQVVQLALYAVPANLELGVGKTLSPRDPERLTKPLMEQVSTRTGRLARAYQNHNEGLLLFAIAALIIAVADESSWFTAACAWVYLIARIVYVPAYANGWVPGRSILFGIGWLSTVLMLLAALF
ncbi:MAPEG family protein [Palleronia marisminoris]|uniref:MAPEG family protein n=1 Tax=Palleronia marisminoris TaxID=315423 RepID=A0A1Y5RUQ3_9RHOB|nr:MAPEG family protein [Palleronia marisminoris]SFG45674.1 MAPEG family protein [Palleronia marisminoris]SLN25924.1 MAPEG family protein [Palleronia marisminoris]